MAEAEPTPATPDPSPATAGAKTPVSRLPTPDLPTTGISGQLFNQGYRFEFFQAVRLLERHAKETSGHDPRRKRGAVGQHYGPDREIARFRALPSLTFPPGAISRIQPAAANPHEEASTSPPEVIVSFFGLFGPNGALPSHYTSLIIDRCRARNKDYSLRDFLDLFNHRSISLFYRAWEKYRFPYGYERSRSDDLNREIDLFTFGLLSLVGLSTDGLGGRMAVDDEAILYYGGHYAHYPRPAVSLELILADYFQQRVEIFQFRGQWLRLNLDQRSSLPTRAAPKGTNCALGVSVVVGARVWSVQSKFRVRIGPLNFAQFQDFMPTRQGLKRLCQLTRLYVGQEFDFDVQVVLKGQEVPWCKLAGRPAAARRLGWNTWVRCKDFDRDVDDAVFTLKSV